MKLLVNFLLVALAWRSAQGSSQRDKIFFLQKSSDNATLLVVTWTESEEEISAGCEMFKDKDLIDEVLKSSGDADIRTLTEDQMQNLLGDCTEFTLKRRRRDVENPTTVMSDNAVDVTSTGLSMDDIDVDPKELRGNGNGQRKPSKKPQDRERQGATRKPQEGRLGVSTRKPQGGRRGVSTRKPQESRQGAGTRKPQGNERQEAGRRTSSTTNSDEVETTTEIPRQEAGRRTSSTTSSGEMETTTEIPPSTLGYNGIPVIFPGTKWCGAGDRAKNYDDLGFHQDTDRCCRAHDHCNDTLAPGETKHNLTNKSSFTKLSCKCDQDFYDCLNRVNTITSNTIGNTYFNLLKRECYMKEHPLSKKCKKYLTLFKVTCIEYERDTSKPKVYQWIPAKKYKQLPFPGPLTVTLPFI